MIYILDTDHLSLLESGNSNCARQLDLMGYQRSAITTITVEERVQGWLASVRRASAPSQTDRLIWAYRGLRRTVQYVNGFVILDGPNPPARFLLTSGKRKSELEPRI
jgi:tRNA(fMet)-specific endonuclease VapC